MKTPTHEEISARAYRLWEERGRSLDEASTLANWRTAEDELRNDVAEHTDHRLTTETERARGKGSATTGGSEKPV
jgi:L-lactate utilization protein LutB